MSRISRKSGLSPSLTKGSNAIDLGKGSNAIDLSKNSGVDMGKKSQPSITSGGIGVTHEVTNIGGMSVRGGVSVDISPLDFDIIADPSEGHISVSGGAEIPGGILGVSGGVTIDTNTGEVVGGSIGGEVGGFGINISNSKKGGLGVEFTYQIGLVELSLGFGFSPEEPTPTPTPTPTPIPTTPVVPMPSPSPPNLSCKKYFQSWKSIITKRRDYFNFDDPVKGNSKLYDDEETVTYEQRIREAYPAYASLSDSQMAQSFGILVGSNPVASFNEPSRPVYYYYYSVGNGIAWSGVEFVEVFELAAEYNATDMAIVGGWHDIKSGNTTVLEKIDAKTIYYARERIGYDAARNRIIWSEWQYTGEFEYILKCADTIVPPPPPPAPFPNPPPRKRNKMDQCCRENLKLLRAIYTGLGIAKFPGRLPATIIQEVSKEGEAPAEPRQVRIADFVDLLDWQFRRDDERWGQWEIQINVKDADLTKEGDQGKSIKFPNLAESIAELEGQMLSVMANVDALVAITTKNLVESGMARQEAIKGYLAAKAIIKYMAFKSTEIDFPVPMTFTPGAETISTLIQESEGHIKGTDYIEKETLRDILLDLLQAAAITRAVHWQKIDSKENTKTQLLNLLKGSVDLAGLVSNPIKSTDGEEKKFDPAQNFEDFIDSVEDGFRNSTGITDVQNPYGKTPERRPRIRQIGDNISQARNNK